MVRKNTFTCWFWKKLPGKYSNSCSYILKQLFRWRALPGSFSAGRCITVFHCECIPWSDVFSERETWKTVRMFGYAIFPLGVVELCMVKNNFCFFQAETLREVVSLGFMALVGWDASPFTARSVLSTGWHYYSSVSGRQELLQNVSFKPSASGFESQWWYLLAVWPSASYSTSLGRSGGMPTCLMTVPTTHRAAEFIRVKHLESCLLYMHRQNMK